MRRQVTAVHVERGSVQLGSASIRESAMLANHAAGVAVGMVGTAAITRTQLKEALRHAGG